MNNKIPLGAAAPASIAVVEAPKSLEEKVELLRQQVEELTKAFNGVCQVKLKESRQQRVYNRTRKIPIGTAFYGKSTINGVYILNVLHDGYYVGNTKYSSISAAAEAVSGVRRSGWTFWKLPDGRTAKEAFKKG